MNYDEYKSLRDQNIEGILGNNLKFEKILEIDNETDFKKTLVAATQWVATRSDFSQYRNERFTHDGIQYNYHESLQIIGFCAAELARIG